MNELLQKHGCANVFTVPEGLKELMSDITREVLRDQPQQIYDYIANYLSVLLITREHGILAVRILDDLCDCRPSVSEHLVQLGMERDQAKMLSEIIQEEVESFEPVYGKEKVREMLILKKILAKMVLDEDMAAKVVQVARNAYRDYWYRKKLMEKDLKVHPDEPWEIAAERTLEMYKRTKPSYSELTRATEKIQAAYRGYHIRRNILRHLKPKPKKTGPKVELLGPPIDVADSREIDLGPVINLKFRNDDTEAMFDEVVSEKLGPQFQTMKTIKHIDHIDHEDAAERPKSASHPMFPDARAAAEEDAPATFSIRLGRRHSSDVVETFEEPKAPKAQFQVMRVSTAPPRLTTFTSKNPPLDDDSCMRKISFAEEPIEVFGDDLVEEDILPSDPDALEVPEDLPASGPSSANNTANSTDVEDIVDIADDE